jgi:hypothetical protein
MLQFHAALCRIENNVAHKVQRYMVVVFRSVGACLRRWLFVAWKPISDINVARKVQRYARKSPLGVSAGGLIAGFLFTSARPPRDR